MDRAALRITAVGVALVSLVLGLAHAWTADDGFITFRVARNIAQGHGPVFNMGERIEASTSPIWTWLMGIWAWISLHNLETLALLSGVLLASGGLLLMVLGTHRQLAPSARQGRIVLPGAVLVLLCLNSYWDFETSGLDISLSIFWVGLSWWMVCRLEPGGRPANGAYWLLVCLVLGLAPLVRAELVLPALCIFVTLLRRTGPRPWQAVLVFVAPGLVYELYRAAYYAVLVPNTAIAKEGSELRLDLTGLNYLWVSLGVSLAGLPVLALLVFRRGFATTAVGYRRAFVLGGVLEMAYVVAVGGDYMIGRLLLPGVALVVAPFAIVTVTRPQLVRATAVLAWATVLPAILQPHLLPDPRTDFGTRKNWLVQERRYLQSETRTSHPYRLSDYRNSYVIHDLQRSYAAYGRLVEPDGNWVALPDPNEQSVVTTSILGITGYVLPSQVYVIDLNGLADPISARLKLQHRGRPGHEKRIGDGFARTRYGIRKPDAPPNPKACGQIERLYRDIRGPLTWSRMWHNLLDAWGNTRMRIQLSDNDAVCAPVVTR